MSGPFANLFGMFQIRTEFAFFLQLRQQQRRFLMHVLHSVTAETRTSPDGHRSRAKARRGHFDKSKVGLSEVVEAIRMAPDVPDPLRQVLDSRHAVQKLVPSSLETRLPLFLLPWLPWVYKFTWTSAFSVFFCTSACVFASFSTGLSYHGSFSEDGAKAKRV